MKKWLLVFVVLFLLLMLCDYLLIPATLEISKVTPVNATPSATFRFLSDQGRWKKWWPGQASDTPSSSFTYKSDTLFVSGKVQHIVEISIADKGETFKTVCTILAIPGDSAIIQWRTSMEAGLNPFHRVAQYRRAHEIKNNFSEIFSSLQSFLNNKDSVYGQHLAKSSTTDTTLIALRAIYPHYPSTPEIYRLISALSEYSAQQGARQTGYPIININASDSGQYQIMAALPIDKTLPGKGDIFPRKMIPGNFIVSEVRGGPHRVEEALTEIQHFFDDYKKISMAIRFQALITDRSKEPDSSKWVTKIYAPVF